MCIFTSATKTIPTYALPPENLMSFSIFIAAKKSLVNVRKIHKVSGSYIKFQVHFTSPSEMF